MFDHNRGNPEQAEVLRNSRETVYSAEETGLGRDIIVAAAGAEQNNKNLVVGMSKRVVAFAKNTAQQLTERTREVAASFVSAMENTAEPKTMADFASNVFHAIGDSLWSLSNDLAKDINLVGYAIEKIGDKDILIGFAPSNRTDGGAVILKRH